QQRQRYLPAGGLQVEESMDARQPQKFNLSRYPKPDADFADGTRIKIRVRFLSKQELSSTYKPCRTLQQQRVCAIPVNHLSAARSVDLHGRHRLAGVNGSDRRRT